jgi:hypothetical protein
MHKAKTIRDKILSLPEPDRELLDRIGAGETSKFSPSDIDGLNRLKGLDLIEIFGSGVVESGPMMGATFGLWQMPDAAHIVWCQICSEEVESDES